MEKDNLEKKIGQLENKLYYLQFKNSFYEKRILEMSQDFSDRFNTIFHTLKIPVRIDVISLSDSPVMGNPDEPLPTIQR